MAGPPVIMNTLSWNCRGVGRPSKIQFLIDVIRRERLEFIFLSETVGRKDKMEWVRRKVGFDGLFTVEPQGGTGGIALLLREMNQVKLIGFSENHINVEVQIEGMELWRMTGIYGEPDRNQRWKTWELLRTLSRDSNFPRCVIGDLNNIKSREEKHGGA